MTGLEAYMLFLAIIGTLSFLSMSVYLFMVANYGEALVEIFEKGSDRSTRHLAFLILAFIGFAVCCHQGAYTLLFWLPSHDRFGMDSLRGMISYTFGLAGGITILCYTLDWRVQRTKVSKP